MRVFLVVALLWIAVPPKRTVDANEWKDHIASVFLATYIGWRLKKLTEEVKGTVQP